MCWKVFWKWFKSEEEPVTSFSVEPGRITLIPKEEIDRLSSTQIAEIEGLWKHPPKEGKKQNMRLINQIIVHCSATPPSMDIGAKEIKEWHLQRGWSDIGYHKVIRRNGDIEDGRSIGIPGAHARGYNTNSIGICLIGGVLEGNVKKADANFTIEQYKSLSNLVYCLEVQHPEINSILGHRDLPDVFKDCPSFSVRDFFS